MRRGLSDLPCICHRSPDFLPFSSGPAENRTRRLGWEPAAANFPGGLGAGFPEAERFHSNLSNLGWSALGFEEMLDFFAIILVLQPLGDEAGAIQK